MKNNRFGSRKGQAAIEYLMTYGWALLIIAIVLVALYMVMQTQVRTDQCNIQTGFLCNDPLPQVFASGGGNGQTMVNMKLYNKQAQGVTLDKVLCTTQAPQDVEYADGQEISEVVTGSPAVPSGGSIDLKGIKCKSATADLKLMPGQEFRGYIVLWYNYENDIDPDIKKTTIASVTSTVAQSQTT